MQDNLTLRENVQAGAIYQDNETGNLVRAIQLKRNLVSREIRGAGEPVERTYHKGSYLFLWLGVPSQIYHAEEGDFTDRYTLYTEQPGATAGGKASRRPVKIRQMSR